MYGKIIILIFFLTQFSACASLYVRNYESRSGAYAASRVKDFAEIFTLTINTNEYGARAILGPLSLGLHTQTWDAGRIPETNTSSFGLQAGWIGPKDNSDLTILFFTLVDISKASNRDGYYLNRSKQTNYAIFMRNDKLESFQYTRLGLSVGLYLGIRAEVNLGEFLDFLFGFLGIDIYDDDVKPIVIEYRN
ncbi:hypothetical protein AB3N59_03065 [Leptospira sp. WS92.C1]